jgi:hypothetical protein
METLEDKHPELFVPDQNINRRKCKRVVPLQVMSLGMSRTGTACKSSQHVSQEMNVKSDDSFPRQQCRERL